VIVAGCGQGGPSLEPTIVTVTLDGQPVDDATVTLTPRADGTLMASGITDSAGRFTATTVVPGRGARPGIAAGEYGVTITKVRAPATPTSDDPGFVAPVPENSVPNVSYIVPKAYGEAATSGLTATITKGRNELLFPLDSKFKP